MARRTWRGPSRPRRRRARTPLEAYLRRRARSGPAWVAALVILLITLAWADRRGVLLHEGDDWSRYHNQTFRVERVVDGDTLLLAAPDGERAATRVRFWGIDAPEIANPGLGKRAEPYGDEATRHLRSLAEGRRVRVTLEPHRVRDRYERLLAFLELEEEGVVLNEAMLAAGLARADDRWAHARLERFTLLERQAQHDGVGLWREEGRRRFGR